MTEIMHQGGNTTARTAPRADDFLIAEEKKGIGGVIRSVQEEANLYTIFGMEAADTKNKNPYCCT